jgi:hypothetical protein
VLASEAKLAGTVEASALAGQEVTGGAAGTTRALNTRVGINTGHDGGTPQRSRRIRQAGCTREASVAGTGEATEVVGARTMTITCVGVEALVDVSLAVGAGVARGTGAAAERRCGGVLGAGTSVLAGIGVAELTVGALLTTEATEAVAVVASGVRAHHVTSNTGSDQKSVVALVAGTRASGGARIGGGAPGDRGASHGIGTERASPTSGTSAAERASQIVAGGSVLARIAGALVDISLAERASVAGGAVAGASAGRGAGDTGAKDAGRGSTVVNKDLTLLASKARLAGTFEGRGQTGGNVSGCATGISGALDTAITVGATRVRAAPGQ